MSIQFPCACGRMLQAEEEHVGRRVKCPVCGAETTIAPVVYVGQIAEAGPPKPRPVVPDWPPPLEPVGEEVAPVPRRPRKPVPTSDKARAALLLGLLSFCLNILAAVPAIILARKSIAEIRGSGGQLGGKRRAVAALILAGLGTVFSVPADYFAYVWIDDWHGRAVATDDLKRIGRGILDATRDNDGRVIPPAIYDAAGEPLLSWRVAVLPYIGEESLYKEFKLDEPWDGPNNSCLLGRMPAVYAHPFDRAGANRGFTYYRVFTGPETPFPAPKPPFPPGVSQCRYPAQFTRGTAYTLLIVEAADAVPWTKPDELPYDANKPLPKLGGHFRGRCAVVLADGTARTFRTNVGETILRDAINPVDDFGIGGW